MRESASLMMAAEYSSAVNGPAQSTHPWANSFFPSISKQRSRRAEFERQKLTAVGLLLSAALVAAMVCLVLVQQGRDGGEGSRRLLVPRGAGAGGGSFLADDSSVGVSHRPERILRASESDLDSGVTTEPGERAVLQGLETASSADNTQADVAFDAAIADLVDAKVVPGVLAPFTPSVSLGVVYNGVGVRNGIELSWRELTPFLTASSPEISIGGEATEFYTMIMADPDAPSPQSPTSSQYCHWLWMNVPGGSVWGSGGMPASGTELFKYIPPNAPIGLHRYIIAIFHQEEALEVAAPESRANFDTQKFADKNGLGAPAAALYFLAQRDPNIPDDDSASAASVVGGR